MSGFNRRSALLLLLFVCGPGAVNRGAAQPASTNQAQIAALQSEMDAAIRQVQAIVNQPVRRFARTPGMRVGVFGPGGWFHEGAHKPDFYNVDVRTTREYIYDKYDYVTSDLNPGVVFVGRELEFNSATKYFYTDRTVPKKKLTDAESLEINRLYRIIGRCQSKILRLQAPPETAASATESGAAAPPNPVVAALTRIPRSAYILAVLVLVVFLVVYYVYRKRAG